MLKIFNLETSKLNYHQKIIKKIKTQLSPLPSAFWKTKPIISGSYAIHLLFKPLASYDDIDIYFETEKNFQDSSKILQQKMETDSTKYKVCSAKNSTTYIYDFAKIQLVNKVFTQPEKLIYDHDFKNVSIAIQDNSIYVDDEIFNLFYNNKLGIRSTQITDCMCNETKMIKIANLCNRIKKYMSKYDLTLNKHSKETIRTLVEFLDSQPYESKKNIRIESNIYYDGSYSNYQNNLVSILHIEEAMKQLIFDPNMIFISEDALITEF